MCWDCKPRPDTIYERKKMADSTFISTAQKLIDHGLEVSPTTGNGFGWAIGFSAFFAFAFAFALWRKDRAWNKERSALLAAHAAEREASNAAHAAERGELTTGFIAYLKRLNNAKDRSKGD